MVKKSIYFSNNILFFIFFIFIISGCKQSNSDLDRADKLFKNKEYILAISFYYKAIDKLDDPDTIDRVRQRLEECYFYSAQAYYKKGDYEEAVKYYHLLSSQFPDSPYVSKSKKEIIDSNYKFALGLLDKKEYYKSYKQLDKLVKGYSLSSSMDKLVKDYMSDNLYNIGLDYYKARQYYFATEVFNFLIKHFSKTKRYKEAKLYLEESYFKDGKEQSNRKAYNNALRAFKLLLTKFPNGVYAHKARAAVDKLSSNNTGVVNLKDTTLSLEKNLIDKGLSIKEPYFNEDIRSLFKMLNKERAKNPEYLQRKVFPIYEKRYVDLKNISILKYERLPKKGFLNPKARKLIDNFISREQKNKAYKEFEYAINSNMADGKLVILMTSKEFFKIDFSKAVKVVSIKGKIFKFMLDNNEITLYIFLSNIKQD